MTGYNHYANCTCGWCVNYGRNRLNRSQVRDRLRLRDAAIFLKRNSANSISSYFVNPNARCPVCSSPVYFYSNEHGSKVFFDELGPPWPKHPCTDNPIRRIRLPPNPEKAPARRTLGIMQELVANANVIGVFRGKVFGRRNPNEWTLLIIRSIERRQEENVVRAEFLDSLNVETLQFTCFSSDPMFQLGGFISKKGNVFSFLHPETLIEIQFTAGSRISVPAEEGTSSEMRSKRAHVSDAKAPDPLEEVWPRAEQKIKFRRSDRRHYQSKSVSMDAFCAKLLPVLKKFTRDGGRKPSYIAARLNRERITTASGASWTPHLALLLFEYCFESKVEKRKTKSPKSVRKNPKVLPNTAIKKRQAAGHPVMNNKSSGSGQLPTSALPSSVSKIAREVKMLLKKTETSTVKQSFSHGRSKMVAVEKKRTLGVPRTRR